MIAAFWLLCGFVAGTAHFALLRWNTSLYVDGGLRHAIGLHAMRLGSTASLLVLAAWFGALPLLLIAAGIMLARPFAMCFAP